MVLKEYIRFIDLMDWCDLSHFIIQVENDLRNCDMDALEVATSLQVLQYAEEKKQKLIPSPAMAMTYGNLPQIKRGL